MIVLALDTCLARCGACLYDSAEAKVLAQEDVAMVRGHAEVLAPMVQRVLAASGKTVAEIERIAVTTGPGTFTGLRIGLSFARALGLARAIPVIGLDALHALRLGVTDSVDIAITAGQSGFAYLLAAGSDQISLVEQLSLKNAKLDPAPPNLARLAAYAATTTPNGMPQPVYIRNADAKPQVTVKSAAADHAETLAALHAASFEKPWPTTDVAAMLLTSGTQASLAECNGIAVGFVIVRAIAGEAEILTLAINPQFRRFGIASKLLKYAVESGRTQGIAKLHLEVAHTNLAARGLYKKHIFTEVGLRKAYYANGDDAVLMAKDLK